MLFIRNHRSAPPPPLSSKSKFFMRLCYLISRRPQLAQLFLSSLICLPLTFFALAIYPSLAGTPLYAIEHGLFGLVFTLFLYSGFLCITTHFRLSLICSVGCTLLFHLGNELVIDDQLNAWHIGVGCIGLGIGVSLAKAMNQRFPVASGFGLQVR